MTLRFGLLGEKLSHSFSPMIHAYLGDYEYPLYEIPQNSLDSFMAKRNFNGINVTIPYKQAVIPYCASLSAEAAQIGAVNTIVKTEDGLLHGYNTDYHGFCAMLDYGKINPNGKKALVLGGGASSRTVSAALKTLGAKEIVVISRNGENNYGNIATHYNAQVVVNTTPVGMYPNNEGRLVTLENFTKLEGVADLIYNPMRTNLLLDAARLGIPCVNGLIMLVAQAEAASRLFTSTPPRPELVNTIFDIIASKTRNIALIGMPGCGKSTVGKLLAQALGRPFADIDELIVQAANKPIPDIFAEDGEEAFRTLETKVLREAAKQSGTVIATGGGVVTRAENIDLLRQNSIIIHIKRDLTLLETSGRPLSQGVGVAALAEKRIPLYNAAANYTIAAASTAQETVKILQTACCVSPPQAGNAYKYC